MTYHELTTEQLLEYADRDDPEVAELCYRLEKYAEAIELAGSNARDLLDTIATLPYESTDTERSS